MRKNLLIPFVVILILALGIGGFLFSRRGQEPAETTETFVTTAPEPTAEPTVSVEKSDFEILVLNGSGIAGAAGDMETILEDAGYTVSDTDNADSYDYKKTEIRAKSSVPKEFLELLQSDIPSKYNPEIGEALSDDDDSDVIVTVGSDGVEAKKEPTVAPDAKTTVQPTKAAGTVTPTTTNTPTPTLST